MKNYPSFRQLQYFMMLARTLSFNKAAERCYVTQSTLSAGIKELETMLGYELFERSSRHVLLTQQGKNFLHEAEKLIIFADKVMESSAAAQEELTGTQFIGMIPTIAPFYGPEFLKKLSKAYPNASIVIEEDLTENLLKKLKDGIIDYAILALPYRLDGLDSHVISTDPFFLALPKTHPLQAKSISKDDLEDMDLILLEDGHCLSDHAIKACSLRKDIKKQDHGIKTLSTLLALCLHEGKGTLLTDMMKDQLLRQFEDIRLVEISSPRPVREIALVWRKTSTQPALLRNL